MKPEDELCDKLTARIGAAMVTRQSAREIAHSIMPIVLAHIEADLPAHEAMVRAKVAAEILAELPDPINIDPDHAAGMEQAAQIALRNHANEHGHSTSEHDRLPERISARLAEAWPDLRDDPVYLDQLGEEAAKAVQPGDFRDFCGASAVGLFGVTLGPCILRDGHDGPLHEDAKRQQWTHSAVSALVQPALDPATDDIARRPPFDVLITSDPPKPEDYQ